eukprot:evm.model.NODE_35794_length_6463_cov_7.710196.1
MPAIKAEGRMTRSSSNSSTGASEVGDGGTVVNGHMASEGGGGGGRRKDTISSTLAPTRVSSRTSRNPTTNIDNIYFYDPAEGRGGETDDETHYIQTDASASPASATTGSRQQHQRRGSGGEGKSSKKTTIPGFLTKTFEIFSSGEYRDLCGWGPRGDTILIKKVPEFSARVLPR